MDFKTGRELINVFEFSWVRKEGRPTVYRKLTSLNNNKVELKVVLL